MRLGDQPVLELNIADLEESQQAYGNVDPLGGGDELELHPDLLSPAGDLSAISAPVGLTQDLLLSVPREVNVEMGSVSLNGHDILDLATGSVVQLGRVVGDPVQLRLDGKVIAEGEVVLINGKNLGVRIVSLRR